MAVHWKSMGFSNGADAVQEGDPVCQGGRGEGSHSSLFRMSAVFGQWAALSKLRPNFKRELK